MQLCDLVPGPTGGCWHRILSMFLEATSRGHNSHVQRASQHLPWLCSTQTIHSYCMIPQRRQQSKSHPPWGIAHQGITSSFPSSTYKMEMCLERGGELPSSFSFQMSSQGAGGLKAVSVPLGNPVSENGREFRRPWDRVEQVEGARPQNSKRVFSPEASSALSFNCFPSRYCWSFQTLTSLAFPPLACLRSLQVLSSPIM